MLELDELQILAQLIDDIEISINGLEKSYNKKNSENFENYKKSILDSQKKVSEIISKNGN